MHNRGSVKNCAPENEYCGRLLAHPPNRGDRRHLNRNIYYVQIRLSFQPKFLHRTNTVSFKKSYEWVKQDGQRHKTRCWGRRVHECTIPSQKYHYSQRTWSKPITSMRLFLLEPTGFPFDLTQQDGNFIPLKKPAWIKEHFQWKGLHTLILQKLYVCYSTRNLDSLAQRSVFHSMLIFLNRWDRRSRTNGSSFFAWKRTICFSVLELQ